MSSKLTEVLKKLHGKSFNSLPFNNDAKVSGNHLDSILPQSDIKDYSPEPVQLKEEPLDQESQTNGNETPAEPIEDIPELNAENDSVAPGNSTVSNNLDILSAEKLGSPIGSLQPLFTCEKGTEETLEDRNESIKVPDESNKKSRRKQQKTHKCVSLEDSLLGSPISDKQKLSIDGPSSNQGDVESINIVGDCEEGNELENVFDLPEGTVFVQPESVDTSPKVVSLETSRSKKIFKGGSLESAILHCTACNKQLGVDGLMDYHRHPMLKVLICRKCYNWYISGEIEQDTDGTDEQCRWCRQGGDLICCDYCHNSFCKSCIRRNLGRKELSSILDTDDSYKWKCYVCDPKRLLGLIEHCSGVMEALAKQEKKQQEMEVKRKRNIKTSHPSTSAAVSASTISRPSDVSASAVSLRTAATQQQSNLKPIKPALFPSSSEGNRKNSDGRLEPRLIQPKPSSLNHSFRGLTTSKEVNPSNRSAINDTESSGTSMTPSSAISFQSAGTNSVDLNIKNLMAVERLLSLTVNMETTLTNLLRESKRVSTVNTILITPDSQAASSNVKDSSTMSRIDKEAKLNAINRKLLKAHSLYLDSFRSIADIKGNKTSGVPSSAISAISLLNKNQKVKASFVRDQSSNGKLVCQISSQPRSGGDNRVTVLSSHLPRLTQSLVTGNTQLTSQVMGSKPQIKLADQGNPTRTVIKIKPSSSITAAALASGSIPLILNDPSGQQKMVLAPIVVKPIASSPSSTLILNPKPPPKTDEVLVISDSEDEVEKTDTVNLPEIIIHDVVMEDEVSSVQKTSGPSTVKTGSLVLTDKFLNTSEFELSKKSDEECKSLRHKRKKENDDDYADSATKRSREDGPITASPKRNQREKVVSLQSHQKSSAQNQIEIKSATKTMDNEVTSDKRSSSSSKAEALESIKPQSPERDVKSSKPSETSEHSESQPEVKMPKKRGRKRKAEKEAETAVSRAKQSLLEGEPQFSVRRSTRRTSLPLVSEGCEKSSRKSTADVPGDLRAADTRNKETNNNTNISYLGAKKSQKKEDSASKSASLVVRTRRSLACIPDNCIATSEKLGITPRVTRAANRKSMGC